MSEKYIPHFADTLGSVVELPAGNGVLISTGTGAPTAATAGYATGCLYIRTDGSAGSCLYVNTGSVTSSTWLNIA